MMGLKLNHVSKRSHWKSTDEPWHKFAYVTQTQLSCSMCKVMTWWDNLFSVRETRIFTRFGLWTLSEIGPSCLVSNYQKCALSTFFGISWQNERAQLMGNSAWLSDIHIIFVVYNFRYFWSCNWNLIHNVCRKEYCMILVKNTVHSSI